MLNDTQKRCDIDCLEKGKDIYTLGAATCIAGSATNQKDSYMFHYCEPTNSNIEEICDKFESLNQKDKKAHVLITGGFAPGNLSRSYFEKFMKIFKKTNLQHSILWGQKNGSTSLHYSVKNDTWAVYNEDENINSLEELKKTYEVVKIADCDELWIEDKRVK